ncbi:Ig-like domain-containing protein [Adhaeribacter soli]|uniref:Ig-like domain-containing protein n=1 Tax=Adhaeribacter soli TaxID=2607655 RepID=UPI00178627F0|nr:T9SS type A sorting domain-containing protein [Adhaeribacter soli]
MKDSLIINGVTYRNSESNTLFASYDRHGHLRWVKQFLTFGSLKSDELKLSSIDRQGNIYIVGHFSDTLQAGPYRLVSPKASVSTINPPFTGAVIKLDTLGNVIWAKQSTGSDDLNSTRVSFSGNDKNDNLYVLAAGGNACFDSYCFSVRGGKVIKYNPQGQVIGAFTTTTPGYTDFATDQDGNTFLAGQFIGTETIGGRTFTSGTPNRYDVFIVKYGIVGNVLWVKHEGSANADEDISNITTDREGNLYVSGTYQFADATIGGTILTKGSATMQAFLAKYNASGQLSWVHKPDYLGSGQAKLANTAVDNWGNIFTSYLFPGTASLLSQNGEIYSGPNGNAFMLAYNPNGTVRWIDQGKGWNLFVEPSGLSKSYKYLTTDNAGGIYYSNRCQLTPSVLGTFTLLPADGRNFRAKMLDCGVVKATVVSSLTGSLTICDGAPPVLLQAKVTSGGELTYQWQRNNQNIPGATTSTYGTLQNGDYRVIVRNFNGCIDTSAAVTLSIVNQALPTATVTAPTVTKVCLGGSVQLQANTGAGFTYQWKRGNDFIAGATGATYAATQSGSYSVSVTNQFGCSQVSAPVAVTVNEPPVALISASGPTAICQNQSVTLVAPPGQGIQYQWQHNGTDISGATGIAYAASQAGNFTVRITNAKGCSMVSNSIPVTINPAPGIVINVSGSTTICQNGAVTISTPSVNKQTYQWQRNGIDLPGQTSTSLMATQPGDYRVLVTGNANLCSNYSQITTVSIDPGPIAQITAAGPTAICPGGTVALVANSGTGYTYRWYKDNTLLANATASLLNVTTPGNYRVEIANSRGCFNASSPVAVTTAPLPTATITAAGNLTFCAGGSVNLEAATGTGWLYQWQRNGQDIAGATTANYSATQSGDYRVMVTTPAGCSATSSQLSANVITLAKPSIKATSDSTICAGTSVSLFTTATGTYQWLLNGAFIANATTASFSASQAGNYRVVVTNATGCNDTSRILPVAVESLPTATIYANGPLTFCAGGSVSLAIVPGANSLYQWQRNGINISGVTSASFAATQSGDYRVLVTTPTGCTAISNLLAITTVPVQKPALQATSDSTICAGSSVSLFTTSTGSYKWLLNGVAIANASASSFTASQAGNYRVVVTNTTGCSDTSRVLPVTVESLPTAAVTVAGPLTFCAGSSVTLAAVSGTNWLYQWQRNGQSISGATNATFAATQSGNYQVLVSTPAGCTVSSAPITITAVPSQTPVILHSSDTTFCAGGSTNLFTTAAGTYAWLYNGALLTGSTSASLLANQPGSYQVVVTNAAGCSDTSRIMHVSMDAVPTAAITSSGPLTFCSGDSIRLSTSANSNFTYQWFLNGTLLSGKTADSLWATQAGNYYVQVSNARGCMSQASPVTVNLNAIPTATITQSGNTLFASPGTTYQWFLNGNPISGATNQVYVADSTGSYTVTVTHNGCTATSAAVNILISGASEELALSQLSIYPNPATAVFNLKLVNNYRGNVQLQLFDLTGRLIQKQQLRKNESQLQSSIMVETLPTGLYLLRVQQGDKYVMQKLTIKR